MPRVTHVSECGERERVCHSCKPLNALKVCVCVLRMWNVGVWSYWFTRLQVYETERGKRGRGERVVGSTLCRGLCLLRWAGLLLLCTTAAGCAEFAAGHAGCIGVKTFFCNSPCQPRPSSTHPPFCVQIKTKDMLAIRYNDRMPMENHHVASAWNLLLQVRVPARWCGSGAPARWCGSGAPGPSVWG
eukprot:364739-Chlamydomonas_euryale.AAC.1